MRIVNETRGTVVAERAEVARSFWSRFWGLMRRRDLPPDGGMLIERTGSIHTFWMRFPIDVIFTDRQGIVVGLREAMPPNRPFAGARRAYGTIELPAGIIQASHTERGDRLRFDE